MLADLLSIVPYLLGFLFLLVCAAGLMLFVASRRYRFQSGRVNGVVGDLGGGKSMFVVSRVLRPCAKTLASRRGLRCSHTGRPIRQIITNFTFDPTVFGLQGVPVVQLAPADGVTIWHQIIAQGDLVPDPETGELDLRLDALICIDEFSLFCESDRSQLDRLAKSFFVHLRKWNGELWWMAQDPMQVHKRARKFSQRLWDCREARAWWATFSPRRVFRATAYKPNKDGDIDRNSQPVEAMVYRANPKVFRAYRSFETIAASAEDVAAVREAMAAAGLTAGESRRNDLRVIVEPSSTQAHHETQGVSS